LSPASHRLFYRPFTIIIRGTLCQPDHPGGASTSRTSGRPSRVSRVTSQRRVAGLPPPPERLLVQACSNPLANRPAAAELSQAEYHTSASNPGPSTRNRSPPQPLASQAACSSVLSSSSSANSNRVSNSPRSSS